MTFTKKRIIFAGGENGEDCLKNMNRTDFLKNLSMVDPVELAREEGLPSSR